MTVDQLRDYFNAKTDSDAARKAGVGKSTFTLWRNEGIPIQRQALIELQTKGQLKADRHLITALQP